MRGGRPPSLEAALPCGFRFNPTDVELIDHYLRKWVRKDALPCNDAVVCAEVYSTEPWNLVGEDEEMGYFFSHRTHQHQKSAYMSRHAGSGTWFSERKNPVVDEVDGRVIGYKKMLCYRLSEEDSDRPSRKRKKSTGWVMYEYELPDTAHQHIEPVLCLIKKSAQAISSSKKKQRDQIPSLGYHAEVSDTTLPTFTADMDAANYTNMVCTSTALITSEDCNTGYQIPMPVSIMPVSIMEPRPATCDAVIDAADFTAPTSLVGLEECSTGPVMMVVPALPSVPSTEVAEFEAFDPSLLPSTPYDCYDIEVAEFEAFMNATLSGDLYEKEGTIIESSPERAKSSGNGPGNNTGGSTCILVGSETGDQQLINNADSAAPFTCDGRGGVVFDSTALFVDPFEWYGRQNSPAWCDGF